MAAMALDALPVPDGPIIVYGDAADAVVDRLRQRGAIATSSGQPAVSVHAVARVAARRLAGGLAPCDAVPLYVEPPEARPAAAMRPAPA